MTQRGRSSRGSESIISINAEVITAEIISNDAEHENVHRDAQSHLHGRPSVQNSLKLVRDLITIIVSDESQLDKLENIIEKRVTITGDSSIALPLIKRESLGPAKNSDSLDNAGPHESNTPNPAIMPAKRLSASESVKSNTSLLVPKARNSIQKTQSNSSLTVPKASDRSSIRTSLPYSTEKAPSVSSSTPEKTTTIEELPNNEETPSSSLKPQEPHDISTTGIEKIMEEETDKQIALDTSTNGAKKIMEEETDKQIALDISTTGIEKIMQDETDKPNSDKVSDSKTTDSLSGIEETLLAVAGNTAILNEMQKENLAPPDDHIKETGTQTSYAEIYSDLSRQVANLKQGEKIASEVIAKVLPIKEELNAINAILSDVIRKEKEAAALSQIQNKSKVKTNLNDKKNLENDPNKSGNDLTNLEYYVVYDTSEDKRLKTWQRTLEAREKIAENIMAHTGKRPAEILFNRTSTMEMQEKQMIQRLMDYSERMNATQNAQRTPSRLHERGRRTNRPLSEIQETVPRLRKRDIEISGVPDLVRHETMACAHNCPELRTQWMHSDVLDQRIHEKRRELRRVVDNYPDISYLSVAGQRKPIQSTSYPMLPRPIYRPCANHFNQCFCNPNYGAVPSGRVEDMTRMNQENAIVTPSLYTAQHQ